MTSDRKQPGVAFWITVALVVLLVAYPLSFGPACWVTSHFNRDTGWMRTFYRPVFRVWQYGGSSMASLITWYTYVAAKDGWRWHGFIFFHPDYDPVEMNWVRDEEVEWLPVTYLQ